MCTIGVVFSGNQICTFKQCDLIPYTIFNEPDTRVGGEKFAGRYIAMTRQNSKGIWAGVNDAGVGFVAADSYTTTSADYYTPSGQGDQLFAAYEACVQNYSTARDAANSLIGFYQGAQTGTPFSAPDIALITGWEDAAKTSPIAIFIEYMPNPYNQNSVRTIERRDGYFVSTNNFRLQPESVDYPANHSTYLRLRRAEMILECDPSAAGIKKVLTDQYYGETELSICRKTAYSGREFYTQATAMFSVSADAKPVCEYQINGNPKENPLKIYQEN